MTAYLGGSLDLERGHGEGSRRGKGDGFGTINRSRKPTFIDIISLAEDKKNVYPYSLDLDKQYRMDRPVREDFMN